MLAPGFPAREPPAVQPFYRAFFRPEPDRKKEPLPPHFSSPLDPPKKLQKRGLFRGLPPAVLRGLRPGRRDGPMDTPPRPLPSPLKGRQPPKKPLFPRLLLQQPFPVPGKAAGAGGGVACVGLTGRAVGSPLVR